MDLCNKLYIIIFIITVANCMSPNQHSFALGLNNEIKATCGFPGSPKYGRVLHLLEKYEESMVITYECETGYYLLGPMTRTCQSNGTWSSYMPVCDQSVKILGLTSASEALHNYPPQLAVDGNFRTCFFSNRRKPRWWRVELPESSLQNQSIISVALTLPPINAELHFSVYVIEMESSIPENDTTSVRADTSSKYHKCATFRGVFSSKTIVVQCATNGGSGLRGNFLQIEDDYPQLEYFGLCEVDIFVERENYACGQIEVPSNGFILDKDPDVNNSTVVEYFCHDGYRLVGSQTRTCNRKTGQWFEPEPFCERITCSPPAQMQNGFYRVYADYMDVPVVGTRAVYECLPGYFLVGSNDTRHCDPAGEWSGAKPFCEPIDCNHPESLLVNSDDFMLSGAQFRLVNGTTKYSAVAELVCPPLELPTNHRANQSATNLSLYFRCREDGIWTEVIATNRTSDQQNSGNKAMISSCVKQRHNGLLYFFNPNQRVSGSKLRKSFYFRENSISMLHFLAAVVLAAFLSIIIIVVLLFKRNILEWPETNCSSQPNGRIRTMRQSIMKWIANVFVRFNGFIQSSISPKCGQNQAAEETPSFTITPSTADIETARNAADDQSPQEETKDDLKKALATFYEEISSAAKQVFAEDTDRKLLRAARIAAELDAIKSQQESNYHWIYTTPPRSGSNSLPTSLTPSVNESNYHHLPSNSQIYAKVDLIRKHRYRKEKETSVYQVPRPSQMDLDPNSSFLSQSSVGSASTYQLRKAVSSPESVFVAESEYAVIRQLALNTIRQNLSQIRQSPQAGPQLGTTNHNYCNSQNLQLQQLPQSQAPVVPAHPQVPIVENLSPLRTLL